MLNVKSVIGTCIFALFLTEVASWTVDLPVARKFLFERSKYKYGDSNKIYFNRTPDLLPYNNIEGDSPHNTPVDHESYAQDYGYLSYMEKKVGGIFKKGNFYLEGLREAMVRYSKQLENCTSLERSRLPTNRTWVPEEQFPEQLSMEDMRMISCEKVTQESEHVRRLASLVVWAIKELEDIAYAAKYDKKTKESEEDVLLLQLAWALDELARLTGFELRPSEHVGEPTPAPAPTTTPATYFSLPIPNDGPTNANCIKEKSSLPATIRCAVPVPEVVLQFLNITNSSSPSSNSSQARDTIMRMLMRFNNSGTSFGQQSFNDMSMDDIRQQMLECFSGTAADPNTCSGFVSFVQFLNNNGQRQNFVPRPNRETDSSELEILEEVEQNPVIPLKTLINKRSASDPLKEFALFLGKYKVWSNSNPQTIDENSDEFDVKNDLTPTKTVHKRSIVRGRINFRRRLANRVRRVNSRLRNFYHRRASRRHIRRLSQVNRRVYKRSVQNYGLQEHLELENPMQDTFDDQNVAESIQKRSIIGRKIDFRRRRVNRLRRLNSRLRNFYHRRAARRHIGRLSRLNRRIYKRSVQNKDLQEPLELENPMQDSFDDQNVAKSVQKRSIIGRRIDFRRRRVNRLRRVNSRLRNIYHRRAARRHIGRLSRLNRRIYKRSVQNKDLQESLELENPMQDSFDDQNVAESVQKRSIIGRRIDFRRRRVNRLGRINSRLRSIYHGRAASKHVRRLSQLNRRVFKRSVYHDDLHKPRVPENPMQDISYYVKNKPGTNIRPDFVNAARVRLGLQEIFQRGNIAVVQRYGSNYIPGVQPQYAGAIESFTDI